VKKLDIKILRDCPFTALVLLYKKIFELLLSAAKIYSNQSFFSDFSLYNSCIKSLWCYNPPTPHLMLSCHNLCRTQQKFKYLFIFLVQSILFSDFSLYNSCIKILWCFNPPTPHLIFFVPEMYMLHLPDSCRFLKWSVSRGVVVCAAPSSLS